MKDYILNDYIPVELQKQPKKTTPRTPAAPSEPLAPNSPPAPSTQTPTSLADVSLRGSQPCADPAASILFIGMDVHNDSIAVSLASSDSVEVRRYGVIGGTHDDVLKLL